MNLNNGWKINQIIAAQPGWKAVHCRESKNTQVEIFNRAVICWALVEAIDENKVSRTEVRGVEQESNQLVVVGDVIKTDNIGHEGGKGTQYFLGYNDPEAHQESEYWLKQAKIRLDREMGRNPQSRSDATGAQRE